MNSRKFQNPNKNFNSNICYNSNNKTLNNSCNHITRNTIYHNYDLICFQKCSKWILTLSMISSKNKKSFSNDFIGKINEKNINNCFDIKNFNIQNELYNFFPIDIKSNQRFVLEKNQRKIPLIISFDFNDNFNKEKKNEFSTNLNNEYSNSLFEIELNAFLHEDNKINIFKDNINF